MVLYQYNKELWKEVMTLGRQNEFGVTNKLDKNDIITIIDNMDFFNATDIFLRQSQHDLTMPKFKVYDWLAMCIMGRNDDDRDNNNQALKVLVYAYLQAKGNITEFIINLRENDYDIIRDWEKVEVDLE